MNPSKDPRDGAPSRGTVRRALGARPWVEPLLLAFAPVFALLGVVTPNGDLRLRWLWGALAVGASLVAVFSFIEQRRRVTLVVELCRGRREVAMGRFVSEGQALSRDSVLRCYPIQTSFFFVEVRSATCPSSRQRAGARWAAFCVTLLLGWWSPVGLLRTPLCLWSCVRGGELTTPAALIETVDSYVESAADEHASTGIKVLLIAIGAIALLFALALLVARFTI